MDKIVKASRLQIFAFFLSLVIISGFVDMAVPVGLLPEIISDLLYVIIVTLNVGWILLTGRLLEARKYGVLTRPTYKAFLFVGILLIVTASTGRLFSMSEEIMRSTAIHTAYTVYSLTSFVWIATFTAKTLKANETNEEIDINDYFGDIFLIIFWPIGVWIIQPRLNKIFAPIDKITGE